MIGLPIKRGTVSIGTEIINRHIFEGASAWPALVEEIDALATEIALLRVKIDRLERMDLMGQELMKHAINPTIGVNGGAASQPKEP